ncbi:MAG: TPR end-of-group domain-containing protein, partial [Candidatus Binatia bacterium]
MDIVGYSKLLTDEQSEALQDLNQIVRNTEAARHAEAAAELTIVPTGDGMALVFTGSVEEPAECALEISQALRAQPSLPVRMGIHSGPVHHVKDANERANIAGVGINIAQRVMDCGDAGHILVSKRVADDLAQKRRWQPYLHPLGDVEVKHGVVVSLVNLYAETIGNPTPPARLGKVRRRITGSKVGPRQGLSPMARAIFIIAALILALAIVAVIFTPAILRSLGKNQVTSPPQVPAIPSPSSFADTIKNAISKQVTDELQDALSRKKDAEAQRQDALSRRKNAGLEPSTIGSAIPKKSIAVLPFVNMSADKNDEYLSDGMTEELLNALTKVKGLRVPGRSSSFAFKNKNEDDIFRKVGEQLHVDNVLEGSVRKAGDKVRITAQLINVADGFHLWSETYDRDMKDILAVESDVTQRVVEALKVRLGVDEARALKKATENPEAHRLYLLGRYRAAKDTQADLVEAERYFEQALQLDPNYALAYCGLASVYWSKGGNTMPGKQAWAKSKAFAEKALELDPELAEAHLSLSGALVSSFDWSGAKNEINQALELNPNLAEGYDDWAWLLTISGQFDEAIAKEKKALELDPLNPFYNMGWYLYWARRYDEAMVQLHNSIELFPTDPFSRFVLGLCLLKKGDAAEARVELQRATELDDLPWYKGWLGYAHAVSGDRVKAEQILRDLDDLAKKRYVTPNARVPIYLGLGDKEKALEGLEKSYEVQDGVCNQLKIDPLYDSIRNEPRFQAIIQKVDRMKA